MVKKETPTIWTHWDADGITAAFFLATSLKHKCEVRFPEVFGGTDACHDGDFMVDMRPTENISGITVIDHHPGHFENPNYELIWRAYPAGKICWEIFKDKIPRKEWWKLACSLTGDVAIEEMPYEVWKEFPILLQLRNTSTWTKYGGGNSNKTFWSAFPLHFLLSSPINSLCRVGKQEDAYTLLKVSQSPLQLITHPDVLRAKNKVRVETESAIKGSTMMQYDISKGYGLMLILYDSPLRISGRICASLMGEPQYSGYTIMAINRKDGRGSMRGTLCNFARGIMEDNFDYIHADGHGIAQGITCERAKVNSFMYDLHEVMNTFVETNQIWRVL